MLLLYKSLGYLWKWKCSYLDEQVTAGRRGPEHRPPLTYWKSGVELFLLEVRIKSTLGIVLRNKMVHYERRIQNICLFNTQMFLNKGHKPKSTGGKGPLAMRMREDNIQQHPVVIVLPCIQTQSWISWLEWWTTVPRGSEMLTHIYKWQKTTVKAAVESASMLNNSTNH